MVYHQIFKDYDAYGFWSRKFFSAVRFCEYRGRSRLVVMIIKTLKWDPGADNLIDMQGRASRPGAQKETYKRDTLKGYNDMHSIKGHLCARRRFDFCFASL